ncbi:MAG: 5'/3'-nucleotidase SurE [Halobacteriota archaeon]
MGDPTIVVTNDDGIDSVGFGRLFDALAPLGEVVAVAPASDQSAVGRSIDMVNDISEHPLGYAVDGTPAACAITAITALDLDPDLLVSGINKGANLGSAALTRSGTVSAAIEAAYLGTPAIAVSTYIPFERIEGDFRDYEADPSEFDLAARVARGLLRGVEGDLFDGVDYYNVNVPMTGAVSSPTVAVTSPAPGYHTEAELDGNRVVFRDRQFEHLYAGRVEDGLSTDRGAIARDAVSVTPLRLPTRGLEATELTAVERIVSTRLDGIASGVAR